MVTWVKQGGPEFAYLWGCGYRPIRTTVWLGHVWAGMRRVTYGQG